MITYEELDHLIKTEVPQIQMLYEDLDDARIIFRESCKRFIDDFIPDWSTEDERFDCDLFIEMYDHLGNLVLKDNIAEIWRDKNRDLVFTTETGGEVDIDYFRDEELMQIVDQLSKE